MPDPWKGLSTHNPSTNPVHTRGQPESVTGCLQVGRWHLPSVLKRYQHIGRVTEEEQTHELMMGQWLLPPPWKTTYVVELNTSFLCIFANLGLEMNT